MSAKRSTSARSTSSADTIRLEIAKYDIRFKFFRHVVTAGGWIFGIWLVLQGLPSILIHGKADQFYALSSIVEALHPGSAFGYLLSAVLFGLYRIERAGKKRAIKEKARLQKIVEMHDPHRSSSNLTPTGDTPNGRDDE